MSVNSSTPDPQKGQGRYYSYLNSAAQIIRSYKGQQPFAHFLKQFFAQHKKFGSKDRKQIGSLCYSYFRLGKAVPNEPVENRILLALKLCNPILEEQWARVFAEYSFTEQTLKGIFPWKELLSAGIDTQQFEQSFLIQPDLFLRIRPGFEKQVVSKLENAGIQYSREAHALRLNNTVRAGEVLAINSEVVVQDLSSQKMAASFEWLKQHHPQKRYTIYDCCAASGGKSILATDILPAIDLTVSDIRPSIIANLKNRFREAGIKNFQALVGDAAKENNSLKKESFDLVIADVPCTGSGAWARTPEQLFYFEPDQIEKYTALQKNITESIIQYIKPGSYLLYSTCSVFKAENEERVVCLQKLGLTLISQQILAGYELKADTMFAALLKKI